MNKPTDSNSRNLIDVLIKKHGIEISLIQPRWLHIKISGLDSEETTCMKREFVFISLYLAMEKFLNETDVHLNYDRCVVVFQRLYNSNRPIRQIEFEDGTDVKAVIDFIKSYFFKDDNVLHCSLYHQAKASGQDGTEIFVIPDEEFAEWIQKLGQERPRFWV